MTLGYALELAMTHELAVRELYFELWKRAGRTDVELAALWEEMVRDEAIHATLLRQLKDALLPEQLDASVSFPLDALDRTVHEVEAFRNRLRAGEPIDADEVFRFVVSLELGEQNGVLMQVVQICPTEIAATVYEQLKDPVDSHLKSLFAHIGERTTDDSLRQRIAEVG